MRTDTRRELLARIYARTDELLQQTSSTIEEVLDLYLRDYEASGQARPKAFERRRRAPPRD